MSEPRIGRILKDFAPGVGNPRNSEGAFLKQRDGALLFVFSRFVGTSDRDHATASIAAVRSFDGGETWTEPEELFTSAGEISVLGGIFLISSGLGILQLRDCKTLNMLPALLVPPVFYMLMGLVK